MAHTETPSGRNNDRFPVSKQEFCRFCRLLYERHLVAGVGGNVSARAEDRIYLTPSGCSLRELEPPMLVEANDQGETLRGGTPTKDMGLHLEVLHKRPDALVVCHLHGAYLIAASTLLEPGEDSLPPLTPGFVYFAYPLPLLPFIVPGEKDLAERTAAALSEPRSRAVLLQNHGLVTIGRDFNEALNVAEEIEEAARIFVLTGGKAKIIPADKIGRIR